MNAARGLAILVAGAAAWAAEPGRTSHFRVGTNVVLVAATVLDQHDHPVSGLSRANFRVFEDKAEQTISYFGQEEVPLSLAIVFDTSGSMEGKISGARNVLNTVLHGSSNTADEFSLITFSEHPEAAVSWTRDTADIQNHVLLTKPRGRTSLLDAIRVGIAQMQRSRNARRAVVIFSDGGDNDSRYTERQLAGLLDEAGVQMYAIDMSAAPVLRERSPEEVEGPDLLSRLCSRAGGRYYRVENGRELAAAALQISRELRWQYVVGYTAPSSAEDGKFHRVRLQVLPPEGVPKLSVYWRRGYRAPVE